MSQTFNVATDPDILFRYAPVPQIGDVCSREPSSHHFHTRMRERERDREKESRLLKGPRPPSDLAAAAASL